MKTYSGQWILSIVGFVLTGSVVCGAQVHAAKSSVAAAPSATPVATPVPTPGVKSAVEELTKSSPDQLAKDFSIACEMSKLSINLAKTPAFKNDPADLAYRVAELMSGAFRTPEVKDTYRAITNANPDSRVELWHKSAKELGVVGFKCKTIGFR